MDPFRKLPHQKYPDIDQQKVQMRFSNKNYNRSSRVKKKFNKSRKEQFYLSEEKQFTLNPSMKKISTKNHRIKKIRNMTILVKDSILEG